MKKLVDISNSSKEGLNTELKRI